MRCKQAGVRQQVKVLIGGAPITQKYADEIGADGYSESAAGAVNAAKKVPGLKFRNEQHTNFNGAFSLNPVSRFTSLAINNPADLRFGSFAQTPGHASRPHDWRRHRVSRTEFHFAADVCG